MVIKRVVKSSLVCTTLDWKHLDIFNIHRMHHPLFFAHLHISHLKKMDIFSYVFSLIPLMKTFKML